MSSQQFSRSGPPPANLGPAPPPISTSGSTGLINPTTTGKATTGFLLRLQYAFLEVSSIEIKDSISVPCLFLVLFSF